MHNVGVSFLAFFLIRKWWPRNRKWWPFGANWVPLVIKTLHRKKMGNWNAFPVPEGTSGSLSHLWHVLDHPYFTFMKWWLTANLNHYESGLGYINLCTFRHTIKVTDHHYDGAKVVPCELITFDYTHQHITGNVDTPPSVRSLYHGRVVTRLW